MNAFLLLRRRAPLLGRVVAGGVVTSIGGCAEPTLTPLEPVKVGALASLSGTLGPFGTSLQKSITLAVEQVNAAGGVFDGRPLQLIVKDTTSDPATAAALAQELLDEGVAAIVGPESSGQSAAVLGVLEPAATPMVSCCATSTELSSRKGAGSGFFFRTAPSDALQGKALASLARNGFENGVGGNYAGCNEAAVFARGDNYGDGFARVFCENFATTPSPTNDPCDSPDILARGTLPIGAAEPSLPEIDAAVTQFTTALGASSDPSGELCIAVLTFGFEGGRAIATLEPSLASIPHHYLTGDGAQESRFLQALRELPSSQRDTLLPLVLGTVPTHATSTAYDQFDRAFRARHGSAPGAYAAQAFDTMFVTALAISEARSTTGLDVRNALFSVSGQSGSGVRFEDGNFFGEIAARLLDGKEVDYVGPSGELTFNSVGDVKGDYMVWQVELQTTDDGPQPAFVDRLPLPLSEFDQ